MGAIIGLNTHSTVLFKLNAVGMQLPIRSIVVLGFLLATVGTCRKNQYIVPGATWYDTSGDLLSAHAGGIVESDGVWYWFGQNERQEDKALFSGRFHLQARK